MKNIHVLPTEKPSILYAKDDNYKLANSTMVMDWYISSVGYKPYNIYITSDEEIKEGDWFHIPNNFIGFEHISKEFDNSLASLNAKKIILTTDQDLIKDGVQAIDDEFLEWFVKNPSCEYVEVQDMSMQYHDEGYYEYKIIIPQEDWLLNNPQCKQIESCSKSLSKKCICPKEEPKQETLEDAAYNYASKKLQRPITVYTPLESNVAEYVGFINGAKWYNERTCKHSYTLTDEQGHRVIKCSKCNDTQPI